MSATIAINSYSVQNIWLGDNYFITGTYTNGTGSTVNLVAGLLMGQVLADAKWLPCIAASTDGSEMPRALCGDNYTVADGATVTIYLCRGGKVNKNAVTLNSTDAWTTTVRTVSTGGGKLEALFIANTDIILEPSTELSNYDNS